MYRLVTLIGPVSGSTEFDRAALIYIEGVKKVGMFTKLSKYHTMQNFAV